MNAADVRRSLRAALEHEPLVNVHRDRIEIDFNDGVATLSGEVADVAAKRRTLELAAALPPVRAIVDRLHVRPVEAMGDGAIADHVVDALTGDSVFDRCGIRRRVRGECTEVRPTRGDGEPWWTEIRVEDGVVTLDGDVPSLSHKRLAGALAWWVPGTRDVVNGLGVEPEEQDTDQEIVDGLLLVLEKDPIVDASQIRASCKASVVTLEGLARSDAEREAAEFDAWALFGVDRVVNRIDVRKTGVPWEHAIESRS
jgi:osmotically-inducible protein OsmY